MGIWLAHLPDQEHPGTTTKDVSKHRYYRYLQVILLDIKVISWGQTFVGDLTQEHRTDARISPLRM